MDTQAKHIQKTFNDSGELLAVQIDAQLWNNIASKLEPIIEKGLELMYPAEKPEPLDEWLEFKKYWDFKYPIEASVLCKNCGTSTEDWENDPQKPFRFKGASLSGLAVFTCLNCQALVRKKHFKDHICFEFSTCGCGV